MRFLEQQIVLNFVRNLHIFTSNLNASKGVNISSVFIKGQNNWENKIISLIMLQLKILIRFQWISSKTIIITIKVYLNSSELYQVDYHIRFNIILSVFSKGISVLKV